MASVRSALGNLCRDLQLGARMKDLLFWVGIAALVGIVGWGTYYLSADCAKRGGVLIKGYGGNPVCVDRAKGLP